MSKYQKALMEVEEIAYKQYEDACYNKTTKARAMEYERKLKDDTKILQELIDKETPRKPINDEQCGSCKVMVIIFNGYKLRYCPNCGQRADWGDKD